MAATWSIKVTKKFTYRGAVRDFSNVYHIGTNGPPDATHWTTFSDAICAAEKLIYYPFSGGGADIISTTGYAAGSAIPVFTKNYAAASTGAFASYLQVPGDCAALVRYSTPDRSSKNHPVYCFNYYHAVGQSSAAGGNDTLNTAQAAAMQTYANAWISGFSDGTTTFHRSRPTGDLCTAAIVKSLLTHRDLPH